MPIAAIALIAALTCMPLGQAKGSVAAEFKGLTESREGKQVEAKIKGYRGSLRSEVRRGLRLRR